MTAKKKHVGLTREKATKLLELLVERARHVDSRPEYLYGVSRLAVFGSYVVTNKPRLGDLDIAVELGPKERDPEKHFALCEQYRRNAPPRLSYIQSLYWPEEFVLRALRLRNFSFSFHEYSELATLGAPYAVLYRNEAVDRESFFAGSVPRRA